MTENEVLEILKKRNIHREQCTDHLLLDGEQIGEISNGYIFIADYIPSKIGKTYRTTPDTALLLSKDDAEEVLLRMLDLLEDSAERYEEENRHRRLSVVRKYFDKRKERREMQEWMV